MSCYVDGTVVYTTAKFVYAVAVSKAAALHIADALNADQARKISERIENDTRKVCDSSFARPPDQAGKTDQTVIDEGVEIVSELTQKVSDLEAKFADLRSENRGLIESVLQNENELLRAQISTVEKSNSVLESENKRLCAEVAENELAVERRTKQVAMLEAMNTRQQKLIATRDEAARQFVVNLSDQNNENERLRARIQNDNNEWRALLNERNVIITYQSRYLSRIAALGADESDGHWITSYYAGGDAIRLARACLLGQGARGGSLEWRPESGSRSVDDPIPALKKGLSGVELVYDADGEPKPPPPLKNEPTRAYPSPKCRACRGAGTFRGLSGGVYHCETCGGTGIEPGVGPEPVWPGDSKTERDLFRTRGEPVWPGDDKVDDRTLCRQCCGTGRISGGHGDSDPCGACSGSGKVTSSSKESSL